MGHGNEATFAEDGGRVARKRIAARPGVAHGFVSAAKAARVDSTVVLAATAGTFLLAGFVKGVVGVGLPTVSIGLLGLLMTPAQAAAILVVPSLVTNVWQAVAGGNVIRIAKRLWPMLAGTCIGTALGAVLLPHDDSGRATTWLGLALALYAALGLVKVQFAAPRHAEIWLGLVMGTATGAITVATGFIAALCLGIIMAGRLNRSIIQPILESTNNLTATASDTSKSAGIVVAIPGPSFRNTRLPFPCRHVAPSGYRRVNVSRDRTVS